MHSSSKAVGTKVSGTAEVVNSELLTFLLNLCWSAVSLLMQMPYKYMYHSFLWFVKMQKDFF